MTPNTHLSSTAAITRLLAVAILIWPAGLALCCCRPALAQQPETPRPSPTRDEQTRPARGDGRRGLISEMTAFKTEVPARAIDVVLARPMRDSICASVTCYQQDPGQAAPHEGYIEFRRDDSAALSRTPTQPLPGGVPVLFTLNGLTPDTAYVYRVRSRRLAGAEQGDSAATEYFSFRTPRPPSTQPGNTAGGGPAGGAFTFTIQADSHLDQGVEPKFYEQTLANMLPPIALVKPDFMIDLGDTFMTDKRGQDFKAALPQYDAQRYYFSRVAHSVPLFMVLGNHDGEKGTSGTRPDDIGPWSYLQRTIRFPQPLASATPLGGDTFYSGATAMRDGVGANYYAFEWGDALFIALDPYWSTTERIRGGGGGNRGAGGADRGGGQGGRGGEGGQRQSDEPLQPTDGSWASTLGRTQYDWLAGTLQRTKAKYRFVFIHHLVGGMGGAESRGGAESAPFFEWGGKNADGTPGFAQHRPGWAMPIHDLLFTHRVSAVFHGHDHLYVSSHRDGVVYQCVPQPGNPRGNTRTAAPYGYTSGTLLGSPGHIRVRVAHDKTTVEFVRTALATAAEANGRGNPDRRGAGGPAGEANAAIVHSYSISPAAVSSTPPPENRP